VSAGPQPSRSSDLVREEIDDLRSYLQGVPPEWREAGSFLAYEEKLSALDQELALARITELARTLDLRWQSRPGRSHIESVPDHMSLASILEDQERIFNQQAAAHASWERWSIYATVLASGAAAALALVPNGSPFLVAPAAAVAAGAAVAATLFRWSERARQETKLANYLRAIRNEVVHLRRFPDPAEQEPNELRASARVEALISEVLASNGKRRSHLDEDLPAA